MKNMKRMHNRLRYIILLAALPLVSACSKSFLEHDPPGALEIDVIANKKGISKLLIGAYGALDGQNDNGDMINLNGGGGFAASPDNWIYGSIVGGDAHKGSTSGDQDDILHIAAFSADPTESFFNDKWVCVYEGIKRCNLVLATLKKVTDMSDEEKTEAAAEARFLRGHYYFDLHKMFKNVPWTDEDSTNLYIKNDKDIFPDIEADFKYAMDNLPPTQPSVGQANKFAAEVYLAKTYLYEKKYADALPLFTDAINNGVTSNGLHYDLVPFQNNWNAATENNAESVFAIQNNVHDGTSTAANANQGDMLNYPPNIAPCCGFFQPSFDLVNSYRTTAGGLPYLDGSYNTDALAVKSDQGVSSGGTYTPDQGPLDPRIDWTAGRRGVPYLDWGVNPGRDWVVSQPFAGPYAPVKMMYRQATMDEFVDFSEWAPGTAINTLVIRFADVLLMAAECEVEAGSLAQAETYVNRVRNRAKDPKSWVYKYADDDNPTGGVSTTPAANYVINPYPDGDFAVKGKDYANTAIRFERKLELAMEGQRFFDLVRWGIAGTALTAYYTAEGKYKLTDYNGLNPHFTTGKNEYFPIPQRQIDLSTKNGEATLQQNY